jgi:hypothetical protein
VLSGQVSGRSVGVGIAVLSMLDNFLFIPYYPVWSLLIIGLDFLRDLRTDRLQARFHARLSAMAPRRAISRSAHPARVATPALLVRRVGDPELVVGTSKTFRSLARLTAAAPSSAGCGSGASPPTPARASSSHSSAGCRRATSPSSRASARDGHQLVAGALVAETAMRALRLSELEIYQWALRERAILRRLDMLSSGAIDSEPATSDDRGTGPSPVVADVLLRQRTAPAEALEHRSR